ncbi:hypothetical protein MUG91_G41n77 [Manis pentadactyla]|nr:hypothetical protein MUG91_G41n77 [Manis pentadactyla]
MMKWLLVLTLLNNWEENHAETNTHQPYKQTWILMDGKTDTMLNETSSMAPLNTWFPDLYFNLDKVADIKGMKGRNWRKVQRRISESFEKLHGDLSSKQAASAVCLLNQQTSFPFPLLSLW